MKIMQADDPDVQSFRDEHFGPNSSISIKCIRAQGVSLNEKHNYPPNNKLVVQDQADLEKAQS